MNRTEARRASRAAPDEQAHDWSDEQLVSALRARDADALVVLWERHARPAFALAVRILGDAGWAEEVIQDVFLRLWNNSAGYDARRGGLRPWLLTLTHHAAVDGLRSRRGTARARDCGPAALDVLPWHGDDPDETAWRALTADAVRGALAQLPANQREVMELVYYAGYTQTQIAEQTGQPLGTVKTRLRLGVLKLRELLHEHVARAPA